MSPKWSLIPLGELLQRSNEFVEIDPQRTYRQITVKLWGRGIVLRNEISGGKIAAKKRNVVRSGQFLLSRIDARNGAFGLVPDELDGAVVSNDFPAFRLERSRLFPKYLKWLSKTRQFVDLCRASSEGTTNRVRLKEERFFNMCIPLPSFSEQERIVAKIEQLAAKVEEAKSIRNHSTTDLDIMFANVLRKFFCPLNSNTALGEVITLKRGYDLPKNERIPGACPVFAANGVVGYHCLAKVKGPGVVTGRSGSVGAVNYVVEDFWPLNTALYVREFKGNNPKMIYYLLMAVSDKLKEVGSHTAVPTLDRKRAHKEILVTSPPKQEQYRIVAYLDGVQAKLESLRQLQEQTAAELDALLPSILDKAFKGEL